MVRLVFRPYTQVRRSICTLESLRTSTRVSPGFALLRHSSPSFGSRHRCSHSNLDAKAKWSVDGAGRFEGPSNRHFHCALWFATTILAPVSDSLVRVSRRGKEHHFLSPRANQSVNCPPVDEDDEQCHCTRAHPEGRTQHAEAQH